MTTQTIDTAAALASIAQQLDAIVQQAHAVAAPYEARALRKVARKLAFRVESIKAELPAIEALAGQLLAETTQAARDANLERAQARAAARLAEQDAEAPRTPANVVASYNGVQAIREADGSIVVEGERFTSEAAASNRVYVIGRAKHEAERQARKAAASPAAPAPAVVAVDQDAHLERLVAQGSTDLAARLWRNERLPVGAVCQVHAMGGYYPATVVKHGRSTVTVRYESGAGVERTKTISASELIRAFELRDLTRADQAARYSAGDFDTIPMVVAASSTTLRGQRQATKLER